MSREVAPFLDLICWFFLGPYKGSNHLPPEGERGDDSPNPDWGVLGRSLIPDGRASSMWEESEVASVSAGGMLEAEEASDLAVEAPDHSFILLALEHRLWWHWACARLDSS